MGSTMNDSQWISGSLMSESDSPDGLSNIIQVFYSFCLWASAVYPESFSGSSSFSSTFKLNKSVKHTCA